MKQLKHNNTSVTNINYYIIWCSKYRKNVLINGVDVRLKEILYDIALENGSSIESIEVMPDHVYIFLCGTPIIPIHLIVKNLKSESSKILRQEFPTLKRRLPSLWTRSYYCETIGNISDDTVKKYINNQKNK